MLVSLFLMFVILLQRGRGGGLAGAFGGLGGQSAFGTKAGDVFTVITIVTVVIWVILSCLTAWRLRYEASPEYRFKGGAAAEPAAAEPDDKSKDGEKEKTKPDSETIGKSDNKTQDNSDDDLKLDDDKGKPGAGAKKDAPESPTDGSSDKD
ncbi:MAG: preprotein translocase subunit SecG [Deltaproteobacteria bacterium]